MPTATSNIPIDVRTAVRSSRWGIATTTHTGCGYSCGDGVKETQDTVSAMKEGAKRFLTKPVRSKTLISEIEDVLKLERAKTISSE